MNEFEFDDILYTILKGIISGFLIAYLIILGLRPSAEYPDNIIEIIDNPWIFIVLILINFYLSAYAEDSFLASSSLSLIILIHPWAYGFSMLLSFFLIRFIFTLAFTSEIPKVSDISL